MENESMRLRPPARFPEIPGFDLNRGPEGLEDPIRVKRARRLGSRRWSVPEEEMPEYLKGEKLDREYLDDLTFSGLFSARSGEDLPELRQEEVQVAGFCYTRTIHCECWSFRARRGASRIRYRICDECDPDGYAQPEPALKTTLGWPSLGKLIWMIDHSMMGDSLSGLYFPHLIWPVSEEQRDPESMIGYVSVHSAFYPQLGKWYDRAVRIWAAEISAGGKLWTDVDSIALMEKHQVKEEEEV